MKHSEDNAPYVDYMADSSALIIVFIYIVKKNENWKIPSYIFQQYYIAYYMWWHLPNDNI